MKKCAGFFRAIHRNDIHLLYDRNWKQEDRAMLSQGRSGGELPDLDSELGTEHLPESFLLDF